MSSDSRRLHVVDALRGFAILSIMLLHNIEHFDLYHKPQGLPAWLQTVDQGVWDSLFFLFGGKAYAIFALLFGLTFSIQLANQQARGADFRARFAWRLVLLFGFGLINATFYQGDILMIYAVLGLILIPCARFGNGLVLGLAVLLLLQPVEWFHLAQGLQNPALQLQNPASWAYFGKANDYLTQDSLIDTWIGNLTNGRAAVLLWTWETGRALQTCAMFLLGMLAGRHALFADSAFSARFWKRLLSISAVSFLVLWGLGKLIQAGVASEALRRPLTTMQGLSANMAFMLILVSGFVVLYRRSRGRRLFSFLEPIGRMSLSNYVLQSLLGTTLYYGFGLGLYKFTGASTCLLIGLSLAVVQILFSRWWLARHAQGPLETLWHRATWIGTGSKVAAASSPEKCIARVG